MSEPDNFLNRWSRRKRAVAEEEVAHATPPAAEGPKTADGEASQHESAPVGQAPAAPAAPEFNVSSLPSIDSIGADTDISPFLKAGVPSALRHAALRRVWATDPAIRDFRAPQEMDWDFNSPGLAGFGEIGPDVDVKKMAARIFGDKSFDAREPAPTEASQAVSGSQESQEIASLEHIDAVAESAVTDADSTADSALQAPILQRKEIIAVQKQETTEPCAPRAPRKHGGALPQ